MSMHRREDAIRYRLALGRIVRAANEILRFCPEAQVIHHAACDALEPFDPRRSPSAEAPEWMHDHKEREDRARVREMSVPAFRMAFRGYMEEDAGIVMMALPGEDAAPIPVGARFYSGPYPVFAEQKLLLRHGTAAQLGGLDREDIMPLLESKHAEFREAAILALPRVGKEGSR